MNRARDNGGKEKGQVIGHNNEQVKTIICHGGYLGIGTEVSPTTALHNVASTNDVSLWYIHMYLRDHKQGQYHIIL